MLFHDIKIESYFIYYFALTAKNRRGGRVTPLIFCLRLPNVLGWPCTKYNLLHWCLFTQHGGTGCSFADQPWVLDSFERHFGCWWFSGRVAKISSRSQWQQATALKGRVEAVAENPNRRGLMPLRQQITWWGRWAECEIWSSYLNAATTIEEEEHAKFDF